MKISYSMSRKKGCGQMHQSRTGCTASDSLDF